MIVQFTKQDDQNWLQTSKSYAVQEVHFDRQQGVRYRIISGDAATPALFPASDFMLIDGRVPASWHAHVYSDGSSVFGPPEWLEAGFWTRYFDGDAEAHRVFAIHIQPAPMK